VCPGAPQPAGFSADSLPRVVPSLCRRTHPPPNQQEKSRTALDACARWQKVARNEPGAKAILPEPRSVQKANSYEMLDRSLHHAETVVIEGKSYRIKDQMEFP
jgi:hypothetical protein